jgi:hypothetical protein
MGSLLFRWISGCFGALAKRHGVSPTTVQRWRKRSFVADLPMGPI